MTPIPPIRFEQMIDSLFKFDQQHGDHLPPFRHLIFQGDVKVPVEVVAIGSIPVIEDEAMPMDTMMGVTACWCEPDIVVMDGSGLEHMARRHIVVLKFQ